MVDFAFSVLCCRWGLVSACSDPPYSSDASNFTKFKTEHGRSGLTQRDLLCKFYGVEGADRNVRTHRELFGQMKSFQVVTSTGDNMVDNNMVWRFVNEVRKQRMYEDFNFCFWPKSLGHSYMSNRPAPGKEDKWWHPYVEKAIANFLESGRRIDITTVKGVSNFCLDRPEDVKGELLAKLPAVQHSTSYWLAGIGKARILFNWEVTESSTYPPISGALKEEMELILLNRIRGRRTSLISLNQITGRSLIITSRPKRDANLKRVLYVDPNSCKLPAANRSSCVYLKYRTFGVNKPLVRNFGLTTGKTRGNYFCGEGFRPGKGFADIVRQQLKCTLIPAKGKG